MGKEAVLGGVDDGAMEVEIGGTAGDRLGPCRFHATFVRLDLGQLVSVRRPAASRAASPRSSPGPRAARAGPRRVRHVGPEQPRDDVGVEQVPRPARPDTRAGLGAHLDEPLRLQHLDRLAHHRAADTEARRPARPPSATVRGLHRPLTTGRRVLDHPSVETPSGRSRGPSSQRPVGHAASTQGDADAPMAVASTVTPRRACRVPVVGRDQLGQLAGPTARRRRGRSDAPCCSTLTRSQTSTIWAKLWAIMITDVPRGASARGPGRG